MSRKSGALTYPEPLGPPRPLVGDLYLLYIMNKLIFSLIHSVYLDDIKALFIYQLMHKRIVLQTILKYLHYNLH
jgi:hypothetical protein